MNLKIDSDLNLIGNSLMKTLSEIETYGETPELKAEMLYKFARVKFCKKDYKESYKIFEQLSSHIIDYNLPENIELYYWVARIFEEQGEFTRAKSTYTIVLKRAKEENNEIFINEILDRILSLKKNNSCQHRVKFIAKF